MSLVDEIKKQAAKSGANKGKFIYFKPGVKIRVRFLQDMDDGMKVLFHDGFNAGVNEPCQELYGRTCKHHEDEDLAHRDQYIWSVWDHDAKEVKLLMGRVNNCSPIPGLVGMFDAYGTLMDRDYVITKNGSGTTSSFSVVPMDKAKFRNEKAKPFSEQKVLQLLDKAFPSDGGSSDDDEEQDDKKSKGKSGKGKKNYEDMTAKELYDLCQERDIEVPARKSTEFYINKLEEADAEEKQDDDWGDEHDEKPNYDDMSAKELYNLCKEREIEVETRKPESYYIKKLEAWDKENDSDTDDEWDEGKKDDEEEW
ncbi:MAG: hypothetical protein N3B21_19215 [Clostridia bacterium]|nr:hypothetical protein [Clostridia bacterium]